MKGYERGSATVEMVGALLLLVVLTLGVVQVALSLYARNAVIAAAHEGARAGVERSRALRSAGEVAEEVIRRSAGGLVKGMQVRTSSGVAGGRRWVAVRISGRLIVPGPLPVQLPVAVDAEASGVGVVP